MPILKSNFINKIRFTYSHSIIQLQKYDKLKEKLHYAHFANLQDYAIIL